MRLWRVLVMGLVVLGFGALESAEGAVKLPKFLKKKPTTQLPMNTNPANAAANPQTPGDGDVFNAPLVPKDLLAKLKLNDEQKPDVDKFQTEFSDKMKDVIAQAKKDVAKNAGGNNNTPPAKGKGKGKGGAGGAKGPDAPGLTEAISLRNDYEDKVYKLLDDGQQKTWLDYKAKKGEGLLNGGNGAATTKTTTKK
jgi:hypothetical protein